MNDIDIWRAIAARHPAFDDTAVLDDLRAAEYGRLDVHGLAYLDYTGAGLFADSQLRAHLDIIRGGVLGNPHSASPSSTAATTLVEGARRHVLRYFNAQDRYVAVFTLNASGALKLVAESYPFSPDGRLLLTFDNHNSVNGIREFATRKGARVDYVPLTQPDLRIDGDALTRALTAADRSANNLFAFPAQSNFSGVKHPLELIGTAHAQGCDVLLDAAAFVPTNALDLGSVDPDFVAVSFYKMFGYPTGVGCLLIHERMLPRLHRPWFAGGTVNFATVQGRSHILSPREAGFEDGTLNFLDIPAVSIGLAHLQRIGLPAIQARVAGLTDWMLEELLALRHSNGRPLVRVYGPTTMAMRGGTITINGYDPEGHLLDYRRIEELAGQQRISLRTGCFCNPGAGEAAEALTEDDMRMAGAAEDMNLTRFVQFMRDRGGKSAGAMRASLGLVSNIADARRFVEFIAGFRDQNRLAIGKVTFDIESCRVIRDGS